MKYLSSVCHPTSVLTRIALPLFVFAVTVAAANDPFAGKWNCDKNASNLTAEIPDGLRQEIKRKGDAYQILTVWREPRSGVAPLALLGIMTTNLTLSVGGEEKTNQVGPFMQVAKTTQDGNKLVTDWTAVVNGQKVTGQWTHTLAEDGKSFTLEIQESTEDGKSNNGKLIFNRK